VVEQPIRNRQVVGSTPTLGSSFFISSSLNPLRCKVVANSEFFTQRIHRAHLRFAHALHVNVHRQAHVAVAENCLNRFVVHAQAVKVCREAAAESVPAVPLWE
jgi:hypothetical protein